MIAYEKREKKRVEREEAERKLEELERQKAAFAPTAWTPTLNIFTCRSEQNGWTGSKGTHDGTKPPRTLVQVSLWSDLSKGLQ